MVNYKCFFCGKKISDANLSKITNFSCPYCGSKIFFKERIVITRVKAV
ncbi:DNA-directed RNA polymerase subunit P [Candidatus Pacearchaeota archaeon CG_4_9_14_3_um_filter_31_7]|nr:MAG: DNA-directed RNA polymerase subunit P [Candidatus Pacearchaeota archaeon CG10_big_fil_rev_8_21_14_0_10_31_59]PIZ80000.1 MAG: DNA-directed RNA polymerase subunit P [Candidatus Pacearchaeota archaeon CG_4_10_14_0_2_um_filter_31_10]PJA70573.1 MAG: DNA-directed RNA polymerase subunit P [Candidatus Pacearchaeota archaeon CG_4_9_14_3_um_filter_31_7]